MAKQPIRRPIHLINQRAAIRQSRGKGKFNADTHALEKHLVENEGYMGIAEMAFRAVDDARLNLELTEQMYGTFSDEYRKSEEIYNRALKTALPYFAARKQEIKVEEEVSSDAATEAAILEIMAKHKPVDADE